MSGQLDRIANVRVGIDTFHERIHNGRAFVASRFFPTVANSAFARLIGVVNSGAMHGQFRVAVDAKAVLYVRE